MKPEPLTDDKIDHIGIHYEDVRSAYLWAVDMIDRCVDRSENGVMDIMGVRDVLVILKEAFEGVSKNDE